MGIIALVETFFIVRVFWNININVILNWTYFFNTIYHSRKKGANIKKKEGSNCCYKYLVETLNPYKNHILNPINLATMRLWPLHKRTIKIINIFVFPFGHRISSSFLFVLLARTRDITYDCYILFTYDWNFSGAYTIYTTFFSIYFCSLPHSCSVIAIQFTAPNDCNTAQPNSRLKCELHKNYF